MNMKKIKRILIANRGEIAVRIMRSCREMDIETVAVYSQADRYSMHVWYAHKAYCIGEASSLESYLNVDKIIQVAKESGADAIHPGYGFLSENTRLVERCTEEGIIFIGPRADTMLTMGDKIHARECMVQAGVPVVPGTQSGLESVQQAIGICREIGYPVMLKASMGGGGKGIRLVRSESDLADAFESARSEAMSSFADDTVYVEKFIENPHHIEFQILGDQYGNILHLYDRECSVQRRNQKILEETPSPFLSPELREEMGDVAVRAARAVNYVGAGTIEFLVDAKGNYYFLEMNTRLQVEHPVTEEVLSLDLVKEQIRIAEGKPLRLRQREVVQRGHAIEVRICAENPEADFIPSPGVIQKIIEPDGIGVRVDSYIYQGYEIPMHYDPMIAKLIVWDFDRTHAVRRLQRVLHEFKILGVKTNIGYLGRIAAHPEIVEGCYDTGFIAKNALMLQQAVKNENAELEDIAILVSYLDFISNLEENRSERTDAKPSGRWKNFGMRKGVLRI